MPAKDPAPLNDALDASKGPEKAALVPFRRPVRVPPAKGSNAAVEVITPIRAAPFP